MESWDVASCGSTCAATGQPLTEGEECYAVLYEDGDTFRREDFGIEAWPGPPADAFCFFKTRVPVREKKKRLLVDNELLVNLFTRLAGESDASKLHFRFVLALILMRKRLLKYEDTTRQDETEVWGMRLVKEQTLHTVVNPRLNEDEISRVSEQLSAILHGDTLAMLDDRDASLDAPEERDDDDSH